jgi:hypothetical protein
MLPNSPMLQRKNLNTSIHRSSSLIQQPQKSNKNIGSALVRKSSSKEKEPITNQ